METHHYKSITLLLQLVYRVIPTHVPCTSSWSRLCRLQTKHIFNNCPRSRFGGSTGEIDHIGSTKAFEQRRLASFKKTLLLRGTSVEDLNGMTAEELVEYNPKLVDYTPTTRIAYAKFKTLGQIAKLREDMGNDTNGTPSKATFNKVNNFIIIA